MSIAKFPYDGDRVNIKVTFEGQGHSVEQRMLVDTGFEDEGIISEEIATEFKVAEAGQRNMGFGYGTGHFFNVDISPIGRIPNIRFYTHYGTEVRLKSLGYDGLIGVKLLKILRRYEGDDQTFYLRK